MKEGLPVASAKYIEKTWDVLNFYLGAIPSK